jgi:hypothetical protein
MPPPQFRLRTLLVAVAVAGVAVAGGAMWRRGESFRRGAARHSEQQAEWAEDASSKDVLAERCGNYARLARPGYNAGLPAGWDQRTAESHSADEWDRMADEARASAAHSARRAAYHSRLRSKYERAARYPWLPVAPDPPEPY